MGRRILSLALGAALLAGASCAGAGGGLGGPAAAPGPPLLLDDFEDVSGWSAHPADGVHLDLSADPGERGRGLRLDFAFTGGGYAVARKAAPSSSPMVMSLYPRPRIQCQTRSSIANHPPLP